MVFSKMKQPPQPDNNDENLMVIPSRELLTLTDCKQLVQCEGWSIALPTPEGDPPELKLAMRLQLKNFKGTLRFAVLIYRNERMSDRAEICEGLLRGLLDIVQAVGKLGYLTRYAIYTTEEQKRACVVGFWPVRLPHDGYLQVPRRMDDLLKQNFHWKKVG